MLRYHTHNAPLSHPQSIAFPPSDYRFYVMITESSYSDYSVIME